MRSDVDGVCRLAVDHGLAPLPSAAATAKALFMHPNYFLNAYQS